MTKPHQYPGILAHRPELTRARLKAELRPDDKAAGRAAEHEDYVRFLMKLDLLALDCGITAPWPCGQDLTAADWMHIALTLASRHVPGFMPIEPLTIPNGGKRRGRPSKDYDAVLLAQMDALIAKGHSILSAADKLKTKWQETASTLDNRYRRMKRVRDNLPAFIESMRKLRDAP